ncbi:MAG: FAD-dependent oxidoreductase [Candidatus Altiarchaeota archaeon]|nr:FAD-dependent oxidoreductase [Candidatus Altiarchaeota archaeon]
MYDLAIIGSGPAGLTAAIYAQRYNMKSIVFGDVMGGLMTENPFIENYPGFKLVDGAKLGKEMEEHAKGLGAELKMEKIKSVEKKGDSFELTSEWDTKITAKTVLIAHGLKHRKLGIRSENEFHGKGVSSCATCDGAFFKDNVVAVVGGGDSAGVAALILSEFASKVYVIYRRDKFFRMQSAYIKKMKENGKTEFIFSDEVVEILGKEKLEGVKLKTGKTLELGGLFIEIGFEPLIPFTTNFELDRDKRGFIKVGKNQATNIDGVFAAGDITDASNLFHQIATAVGEGSIAADSAYLFGLNQS